MGAGGLIRIQHRGKNGDNKKKTMVSPVIRTLNWQHLTCRNNEYDYIGSEMSGTARNNTRKANTGFAICEGRI